jgi:guanylate kinase
MVEIYEHCYKMYRNIVQKLSDLANEIEKSKKSNIKEKNIHIPCMIIGPSAVGKDTMINKLKKKYPEKIYKLPSYTTRPIRENEKEGVDYYFVTHEEFDKMEKEGKLFGIQKYNNNKYASNKNKLREALKNKSKIIVLNYNIETANEVKDEMDFNFIAILPPSESELRNRLIKRKTKAEEIEKRMKNSIKEIQLINEANYIDYRLVNDDEERAFNKLENHLKEIYPQLL